jgi:hypothetical protein
MEYVGTLVIDIVTADVIVIFIFPVVWITFSKFFTQIIFARA